MRFWAKSIPGKGESKCKCPDTRMSLASLRRGQRDWEDIRKGWGVSLEKQKEQVFELWRVCIFLCMFGKLPESSEQRNHIYMICAFKRLLCYWLLHRTRHQTPGGFENNWGFVTYRHSSEMILLRSERGPQYREGSLAHSKEKAIVGDGKYLCGDEAEVSKLCKLAFPEVSHVHAGSRCANKLYTTELTQPGKYSLRKT